jgi:hypothetical protein
MLSKDAGSGGTGCPSIYLAENGDFVVQGRVLDAATEQNLLNVLPGERGVFISAAVLLEAAEKYRARQ